MRQSFTSGHGRKRVWNGSESQNNLPKKTRELIPKIAGKIMCVELTNFMCHEHLKLEFDVSKYNCSYIIGPNGSGKSALFAALNIGLGGAGRLSERGKSVQNYIKEGQQFARVRIFLTNDGINCAVDFDKVIIVERQINDKVTHFQLKTCAAIGGMERTVSKKKADLDRLLYQFNIELDNPLAWLSQDRSRQFLQSMKPDKLYELYRKSSEMDNTESLFRIIDSRFQELTKILNSMDREKNAKEEHYKEMKRRHDALIMLKEKKEKCQQLYWYQIWAPLRDKQDEISLLEQKQEENENRRMAVEEEMQELQKNQSKIDEDQGKLSQERERALERCKEKSGKIKDLKKELLELILGISELDGQIGRKRMENNSLLREKAQINGKIKDILGELGRDIDAEKSELEKQRSDNTELIASTREEKRNKAVEIQKIQNIYNEQRKKFRDVEIENIQLEEEKKKWNEERHLLEQSKVNRLALFGQDIPKLVRLINANANLFGTVPLGPIGNLIKLKDQKWANAVEFLLKNSLGSFICNTGEDRIVFDDICRQNNIKTPEIITSYFSNRKFDISRREPPPEFETILRVLDVENATVFNTLLDMAYIESILLFERDDLARNVMYKNPPPNVRKAITMTCSEVIPRKGRMPYRYFSYPGQFQSRVLSNRFTNKDEQEYDKKINHIDEQLKEKRKRASELRKTFESTENILERTRKTLSGIELRLHELNSKHYGIQGELQKLEEILIGGDRVENLKESLREIDQQHDVIKKELQVLNGELAGKKEKEDQLKQKLKLSQHIMAELKNHLNQKENDITSCGLKREKNGKKIDELNERLEKIANLRDKYRDGLTEARNSYEHLEKNANGIRSQWVADGKIGNDVEPPHLADIPATDVLVKEIRLTQRDIQMEERIGERAPTSEDLETYARDYQKFKSKVRVWTERQKRLEKFISNHKKRFNLLKTSLPQKIESWFKQYMNIRGFKASLDVNDDLGIINIKVVTHKAVDDLSQLNCSNLNRSADREMSDRISQKRVLQDLKGLSGGERSFTTASFVMALWNCMESPFRCLDEFDVFMDMVNRRMMMEMLIDMAMENKDIQFFFFTPQSIQELKSDGVEVFQMKKKAGIFDNLCDDAGRMAIEEN